MSTVGTESAMPGQNVPQDASDLLPLIYDHLRHVAAERLARERPGQTLQPTALVHEAWLRLERSPGHQYQNEQHFFRTAAKAMRRILIENARRKQSARHGGNLCRVDQDPVDIAAPLPDEELLRIDQLLTELAAQYPQAAELVELRFFVGLTGSESAEQLGISRSTADRTWRFARAWLFAHMYPEQTATDPGPPIDVFLKQKRSGKPLP